MGGKRKLLFLLVGFILLFSMCLPACNQQEPSASNQQEHPGGLDGKNTNNNTMFTLKIEASEGGTIPAGKEVEINGQYQAGDRIRLITRPMPGYYFTHWTSSNGGNFDDASDSQTIFTMPESECAWIQVTGFRPRKSREDVGKRNNQNH